MKRFGLSIFVVCLVAAWGEDWTQWRGPGRDGRFSFAEPKSWPEKLNIKWNVTIGEGYASPLLAGGKILAFTRQGDDEIAMGIDPENGKVLWQQSYPAPYEPVRSAARHGKGPKSTPLVYQGRLYTFGISGTLSSFDAATGKLQWRKEYSKDFKGTWPQFGTSMSPVGVDGMIVVLIGTNDDGAIAAYDAKSGVQKWIWKGDGPAYASPVVVEIGGVKQVVTLTQKNAVGLSLSSGELLWKIDFPGRSGMNIPTPLKFGARLVLAGDPGTMLVQVNKSGNTWTPEKVWQITELTMRFTSPVQKGNLVFGFTNRNGGMFFCVDSESGKTLWISDPKQGDNAVIYISGELLFLLKDNAEWIVARATGSAFQPLRTYHVAESATYASPLMLSNGMVIKDSTSLSFLTWE
jgi:outer membrane protein assembly factor BamB